ncbi:MAG: HAD hydrolase family protein [Deltaproteobacteria bacterium]|nr:HAD hydrolase family protein [Deltaproteobacteria bacterium]
MGFSFHAVATDYDGTLTQGGRPTDAVLAALARTRAAGRRVVLVTGRILAELQRDFPDVEQHFDALVLENGAVVRSALGHRRVVLGVSEALDAALRDAGIAFRRGEAILATQADAAGIALGAIAKLGLDAQLVRNRSELMITPSGVSKGTGVREALGDLGVSVHCAVAVGDAENDHALLDACELGVAVGNAVDALKARADVVLAKPAGEGVMELLEGPILSGASTLRPRRWQVELGLGLDGAPVHIPGSGANLLVAGESGCGKSYMAGLITERLIGLGYSACVIDPEGDYEALGHLRGVMVVGGDSPLPTPGQLPAALRHRFGSLVVDLSHLPPESRAGYVNDALAELQRLREATGSPHWIVVDEAHVPFGEGAPTDPDLDLDEKGLCLVTYLPERLKPHVLSEMDLFLFPLPKSGRARPGLLAPAGVDVAPLVTPGRSAVLVDGRGSPPRTFHIAARHSVHVRHWHKYMHAQLPVHLHFLFRAPDNAVLCAAGNVSELHHDLLGVPGASVAHHAAQGDFSRWAAGSLQDRDLADALAKAERSLGQGTEAVRHGLLEAIERRYLEAGPAAAPRPMAR